MITVFLLVCLYYIPLNAVKYVLLLRDRQDGILENLVYWDHVFHSRSLR
jgi:hypothetical protein